MNYIAIDTDVASVSLRGRLPLQARRHLTGRSICITFVTVGELGKWMALRNWGVARRRNLMAWQHGKVVLPYDEAVAGTWGELQARAQRRGRPRPANDTWIAACCLVDDLPLATFCSRWRTPARSVWSAQTSIIWCSWNAGTPH